eukprot:TRINITY_DN7746_c2_g1_i1.p1 TRINITY_DN7746_c2_g1~~TRINITY_DN7746_c2_g1_i1.p1  ORF type:complete len:327 (+),score=15.42 TRINITY_DN7746_c2_g1_i1:161-1141(+)
MSSPSYLSHEYKNPSSLLRSKSPSIRHGSQFCRDSTERLMDLVQLRSDLLDQREVELKSRNLMDGENVALRRYNRALEDEILDLENENRRLARMNEMDSRSTVASSSLNTPPSKTTRTFCPPSSSPSSQAASLLEQERTTSAKLRNFDIEVEQLRQSVKALAETNSSLRRQQYRSAAINNPHIAPLDSIQWRISGMTRKLRSMRSSEYVMSPLLGSAILGLHDVEFDFYPNGVGKDCPQRGCSFVLRCDKRLTVTFQLFVGGKRSLVITHTFTGIGGYRHDFKRVRDELELDDTVCIGVDIIEVRCPCCCCNATKTCHHCHHHRSL